jgi:hypothetical protein
MMNVIPPHNGIRKVLDPDSGQSIAAYLIVLIGALGIICHVQSHILTVTYITMSHYWICSNTAHTHGCTDCKIKTSLYISPICTYQLTPHKMVLLEKLRAISMFRRILAFHRTGKFITKTTRVSVTTIQSTP